VRSVTWQQVYARRLRASNLDERAPRERALDVVRAVSGVHAQLLTGAELALSARVDGIAREDVRELLWERRDLVKGNSIRGTLHLHPPEDFVLWRSLRELLPVTWREQWWLDERGLTLTEAERLREAVLAVLDEPLTREEIGTAIGGRLGGLLAADSWGHFLAPAGRVICHGPPRGRNVTFVRCDRWVRGWRTIDPGEAWREILRRYLEAYGPVRRDELRHWLAQRRLPEEDAFDELEEIDVEGFATCVLPGTEFPDADPRGVRLLSHYDVYVIACHPREHLIPEQKERIFLRGAGPNPALLVDGRVAGVWKRTQRGRRVEIRVEPFRRLTQAQQRELADDAARVARTHGAEAELIVS
jgi:Winged helix DNA-binding domain